MRIKYTRYKTVESSSSFQYTLHIHLFYLYNTSLIYGLSMLHKLLESYDVFFLSAYAKKEESNEYQYQRLINES